MTTDDAARRYARAVRRYSADHTGLSAMFSSLAHPEPADEIEKTPVDEPIPA